MAAPIEIWRKFCLAILLLPFDIMKVLWLSVLVHLASDNTTQLSVDGTAASTQLSQRRESSGTDTMAGLKHDMSAKKQVCTAIKHVDNGCIQPHSWRHHR